MKLNQTQSFSRPTTAVTIIWAANNPTRPHLWNRAAPDADRPGDHPRAGTRTKMQLQNLAYPPHGQSLRRHPVFPSSIAMRQHWIQVNTEPRNDLLSRMPSFLLQRVAGIRFSWLRVSGTAKMPQIDQGASHQLHAVMSLLLELETQQQQPFEFILPREGPLHA